MKRLHGRHSFACCSGASLASIPATSIALVLHWPAFQATPWTSLVCMLLRCFTGQHPSDIDRSGASLASTSSDSIHILQILLWCYVFQHFHVSRRSGVDFLMKSAKRDALAALRRVCVVEIIAGETFGDVLYVQLRKSCFFPLKGANSMIFMCRRRCASPMARCRSLVCVLLRCFTG